MTVDIAALRTEAANIIGLLTTERRESFTLDKTADFFDDLFRQLEAAQARIAELESEQEPIGFVGCNFTMLYNRPPQGLGVKVGDKLYTAPPKSVVKLPKPARIPYMRGHSTKISYMNAYRPEDILLALSDAGIVVKDGE